MAKKQKVKNIKVLQRSARNKEKGKYERQRQRTAKNKAKRIAKDLAKRGRKAPLPISADVPRKPEIQVAQHLLLPSLRELVLVHIQVVALPLPGLRRLLVERGNQPVNGAAGVTCKLR